MSEGYWYTFTINDQFVGKQLSFFLDYYCISKKNKYLLLQNKLIKRNEKDINVDELLNANDNISIYIENQDIDFKPDDQSAKVIYEDDVVLVVHKEPGIIVHEDNKDKTGTLANQVAKYYLDNNKHHHVRYLHRLDKDTQGLVMFCKIPFFQPILDQQLSQKIIHREYYAIVKGSLKAGTKLVIDDCIGKDRHNNNKYLVTKTGKPCKTIVESIKEKNGYTLLNCQLETGRTHQIRVHLSAHGLKIVNDSIYGVSSDAFPEMGLFAYKLSWIDPVSYKQVEVTDDFKKFIMYFD